MRLFELRAPTGHARVWRRQGRSEETYAMLEPILAGSTEGFDNPDLRAAQAVLTRVVNVR